MKTIKLSYIILCSICLFLASCSSDEEITKGGASEELVKKAKDFLTGEIVLNTHATLNGVNKTLLETVEAEIKTNRALTERRMAGKIRLRSGRS